MHPLVDLLRREARWFGQALAKDAHARGLAVTQADGTTRAIPVTATPVILPAEEIRRRVAASAVLSRATFKVAQAALAGPERELLLSSLSPLERRMAEATHAQLTGLATARVDYFVSGDRPLALEVNATIPAMQGYSDIAANTFIEHVGRHAGLEDRAIARIQAQNGSNALALYRALLEGYAAQRGGGAMPERILLLCRRNDAQLSEQRYLAARFTEMGTEAEVIHPDELSGDEWVEARGRRWDLVYRHLFVRRLEQTPAPWVERFFSTFWRWKTVLLNPPSAQVEVKASFALLSRALASTPLAAEAGLTEDEVEAAREFVPWTRLLAKGPSETPDGTRVGDLVAFVAAHPDRFVLKRSWDYGGRAVFVGAAAGTASFDERVRTAYGEPMEWPALVARAAADPSGGGFVVQEYVSSKVEPHLLCTEDGLSAVDLYVDFSAYASVQAGRAPQWGGVCRGSASQIVNIVGGGGVLPLLTSEVADKLHTAFRAQLPFRRW
ncbi:MAG TPA: hypothetical protein VE782_03260 [Myxococcaceae bacterium]|nr:hypothetical protein [Myxococcaceae bacterium]